MQVSDLLPPAYHPVWKSMRDFEYDSYWLNGGRGSGKTSVASLRCVTAVARDPKCNVVCYKKHRVEIETSVYAEIQKAINRLGWQDYFRCITSPFEVTFKPTGQKIFFRGLDDAGKSKGITATTGYIQLAWFEEFDQYEGMREVDTVLQSVGRGGARFQMIATYNPPETIASWVNVESKKHDPHRFILTTTYKDWNREWLGEFFFNTMERIKRNDELRYRHEYLGEITGTGGQVFRRVRFEEVTDDQIKAFRNRGNGMDFGQSDPTTIISSNYDPNTETITAFAEWYKSDALNREVLEAIHALKLDDALIYGDVGGGGLGVMHELRSMGIRGLQNAYKPANSVVHGIQWIRDRTLVIDPRRCPHLADEVARYEYVKLRDGTYRNEFPDYDNHCIDALRYSRERDIHRGTMSGLLI